jgi:hypothetical protein
MTDEPLQPPQRRDRDDEGRPRQARPRDELGRPLPYGSAGVEPVSEEPLPPEQTVAEIRRLLAAGRPFAAHEVAEARWKAGPDAERELWQGLAQLYVARTHAARGNDIGARRLLERGRRRLAGYLGAGGPTYGVDLLDEVAQASAVVLGTARASEPDRSLPEVPGATAD